MWTDTSGPWGLAARFKDEWLVKWQAAKLFFISTILTIPFTPIFLGTLKVSKTASGLLWIILGAVGTIAVFFLWLGMWRFWVRIDNSNSHAKRFWFLVLLIGFWWGSCLYYYIVYLPQVIRKHRMAV